MAKKEMTKSEFETLIATIKKSSPDLADQLSTIAENSPKVFESGRSRFRKLVSRDENLTKITAEELGEITKIGYRAFYDRDTLTSIEIPATVKEIGRWAFAYCDGLTSITIPSNVTHIGNQVFEGCTSLEEVIFENGSQLQSIGSSAFRYCKNLKSIEIPSSVTSIGDYAFSGCTSLNSVIFKNLFGWRCCQYGGTRETEISSADLFNKSTAATYLKSTYSSYSWFKNVTTV